MSTSFRWVTGKYHVPAVMKVSYKLWLANYILVFIILSHRSHSICQVKKSAYPVSETLKKYLIIQETVNKSTDVNCDRSFDNRLKSI